MGKHAGFCFGRGCLSPAAPMLPWRAHCLLLLQFVLLQLFLLPTASAVTYANTSHPFSWIDPTGHTKVGHATTPYKFTQPAGGNCQTKEPIIDDTISTLIPIGFTFNYGGKAFTTVYIQTNGRLQFDNNVFCGFGSPVTAYAYPNTNMNYTMRIYGNDLDPTIAGNVPGYNTTCTSTASCFISVATIGTAPNRSFVVTWNNVPEWTSASQAQGAYNLQVILQENGEFIYQYGSVTAGPNASQGQVGWQVSTSDYEAPQTGFPVSNSAIKFYIPQPVAEYRMEQTTWTTAAGQVLDTSGNNRHGTVLGGPQTIAAGKVCRAANISNNANSNQIDAINTGINVPTTVGGAGTITFWYKASGAWTGGGSKDAQLIDATVVNNIWFFLVKRSNGNLRFVVTDNGGTAYSVETSSQSVAANTWKHIGVSWNFNALGVANSDRLRIYLDGNLLNFQNFTSSNTISSQIGSLYIGDNRSGFVGSNGTGRSADGAIDEFRIYNYEGGTALVQRDFNLGGSGCLSHYAVSHSVSGSTCAQTSVTITAHDSSHANITMPNNTTSINLTALLGGGTTRGDWPLISGDRTLHNGTADDGKATYLFNGEFQAVFGYTLSVADTVSFNISDGQFVESEDPSLSVTACVTNRFNACELSTTRCVPSSSSTTYARLYTKLANTAFKLDAVKLKNDGTLETTFNGSVTLDLLVNSQNGIALGSNNCPVSQTAVIPLGNATFASGRGPSAGVSVSSTAFSAVNPQYSAYRDVRVRFTCSAAVCGSSQTACSTDNFALRPTNFTISSTMSNTAQTGTPAIKAGEVFTITSTAVPGYDGIASLANSLASQKIFTHLGTTDFSGDLSQVSGTSPIAIGKAGIATGVANNATLRYDDVGSFGVLKDGVTDASFTSLDQPNDCVADSSSNTADGSGKFGCNIGNQSNTALFGRFYPDNYALWSNSYGTCNGMVYQGQKGLGLTAGLIAYSKNGIVLDHLSSGYATLPSYSVALENGGVALSQARLTPSLPAYTWQNGRVGRYHVTDGSLYGVGVTAINVVGQGTLSAGESVSFNGDNTIYTVASNLTDSGTLNLTSGLTQSISTGVVAVHLIHKFSRTTLEGPYDNLLLKSTLSDPDAGLTVPAGGLIGQLNGVAITAASSVSSSAIKLRFGRLRIVNAYGSDLLPLPVEVYAQFWTGTRFATNLLDNCTNLSGSSFSLDTYSGTVSNGGVMAVHMPSSKIPANNGVLAMGAGKIRLGKPNRPIPTFPPTDFPISRKGSFSMRTIAPLSDFLPGAGRLTLGLYKQGPTLYIREVY